MQETDLQQNTAPLPAEGLLRQSEDEVRLSSTEHQRRQHTEDRRWLQDRREEVRPKSERRQNLDERRVEDRI